MTVTTRSKASDPANVHSGSLFELWLCRAMVNLDGAAHMIDAFGWEHQHVAVFLGLEACVDEKKKPDQQKVQNMLEFKLKQLEKLNADGKLQMPKDLRANLERLANTLGFSSTASALVLFVVAMINVRALANGLALLGERSNAEVRHALSAILGLPEVAIRKELDHDGALLASGLISFKDKENCTLPQKLRPLSLEFAERMMEPCTNLLGIFENMFGRAKPATLELADFDHLTQQVELLHALLRRSRTDGSHGINVLIYGSPGVGKTEFARLMAASADMPLYEVAASGPHGESLEGEQRLGAYSAGESLLRGSGSILLFDEAEDIFGRGDEIFGPPSIAQRRKAWMNRALEDNSVPTIWLTNRIRGIDPAYIRRFTMAFELPTPPRNRMKALIAQETDGLLSPSAISQLAEVPQLAPAVLTRAAAAVRSVRTEIGDAQAANALRILINGTLVAQGHAGVMGLAANDAQAIYEPGFIAADTDLQKVAEGIQRTRRARLCLYGPPGTGKSAFGRWLADQIGSPLHVKKVSDIISPYLGESEQRLARAFRNAADENAVLLLDEVDSFLQDRKGARHAWEVTQVNEMLTQMEAFNGVFIASTNIADGLDPAASRRFDLKVRFGYLTSAQAVGLLKNYCSHLGLGSVTDLDSAKAAAIRNLTPGDYAMVGRRHSFCALTSPSAFVDALLAESRSKRDGQGQAIGFVANG